MSPKVIVGLAIVTLIVGALAAVSVVRHYGSEKVAASEELFFRGLGDTLNRVAEIQFTQGGETLTLKRDGESWALVEKGGYPALAEKARKTAIHVAQMRVVEAKTRRPALFSRLQLEDPESKDAKSTLLRLKDAQGQVLAEAIIGKSGFLLGEIGHSALYVRKPGENQTWKVKTGLDASTYALSWIPKDIMDIPAGRVMSVAATAPDGSTLTARKDAPTDGHFRLEPAPPADFALIDNAEGRIDDMGTALAALELTDVAKAESIDFTTEASQAEVRTFDGLVIQATIVQKGDWGWARFAASPAEGPQAAPEAAKEAAEINARVGGWAYRLPDNKGRFLRTRLDDFKKKKDEDKSS